MLQASQSEERKYNGPEKSVSASRRMSSDFEFEEMHGDEEEIKHDQSLKN